MATDRSHPSQLADGAPKAPQRLRQVLWFVGIWCASLVALSSVAYLIRAVLL